MEDSLNPADPQCIQNVIRPVSVTEGGGGQRLGWGGGGPGCSKETGVGYGVGGGGGGGWTAGPIYNFISKK